MLSASTIDYPILATWALRNPASILKSACILCATGMLFLTSRMFSDHERIFGYSRYSSQGTAAWNARIAEYFIDFPVLISDFAEMGQRVKLLTQWMEEDLQNMAVPTSNSLGLSNYSVLLEDLTASMFPFLDLNNPWRGGELTPFRALRQRFIPGSQGIVIPTGKKTFRFTCHLISNLRNALNSKLPIQIAYAGNKDLPSEHQQALLNLGEDIDLLDITSVLNDETLELQGAAWAIKPFAMLASRFEKIILMDADAIFLQKPEEIFEKHNGFKETGTLLFHDRLVDRGSFGPRHEFYWNMMKKLVPSATFEKSIAMREGYSQEADSGVVVLDKGRLPVLFALLFACWQNSFNVREDVTYRHTHGDKETYWMGLELSEVPYTFAEHYGAAFGYINGSSICGSTIAHVDERKRLLWFNGSLLKRKDFYSNPTSFVDSKTWIMMLDGTWSWVP